MNLIYKPSDETKGLFADNRLLIRPSRDTDLVGIIKLKYSIFAELCPNLVRWYDRHQNAFIDEFEGPHDQDPEKRVFYSVVGSNKIVGCGGLIQKDPRKEPTTGEITDVYLLGNYRGKGLGKALVSDLVTKAEDIGFEKLYLTTRKEFGAATKLYQSLGFEQVKNDRYSAQSSTAWELKLKK